MRRWLKVLREAADKTQEQVADEAGISRSYYTNIEAGIKTPAVTAAKSIAKSLNFPWENFFKEECSFKEHSDKEVG
ncbi:helix-turn-helix transcriptional regulator [Paenibacillus graminis]|uniref:helix-turn-helix transcriptional regulator n=1 Tax=Paenibacillus graminis TaxID=189425 RepID=UPI002DBBA084|nr:helix-turn-helix transcriptional regulator [Paenibacillus graminis]MEC0169859.1 helix-turn-helix transcriptional regulator [Paenibacillus graminis]